MRRIWAWIALLVFSAAWAVDWPVGEWRLIGESEHVRYYELAVYKDTEKAIPAQEVQAALGRLEAFLSQVGPLWDWPSDAKIEYYKFYSLEDMDKYGGQPALGKSIPRLKRLLSIYPSHSHEVAHLLSIPNNLVRMSVFWLEGLAESYAWPWVNCLSPADCPFQASIGARNGHSLHYWAQKLLKQGQLPSIPFYSIYSSRFAQLDVEQSYPVAGSFVGYLLQNDPVQIKKFRDFMDYWNTQARSEEDVLQGFERIFGMSLLHAEEDWKKFLETWDESSLR